MKITNKGLIIACLIIAAGAVAIWGTPEIAVMFVVPLIIAMFTLDD